MFSEQICLKGGEVSKKYATLKSTLGNLALRDVTHGLSLYQG